MPTQPSVPLPFLPRALGAALKNLDHSHAFDVHALPPWFSYRHTEAKLWHPLKTNKGHEFDPALLLQMYTSFWPGGKANIPIFQVETQKNIDSSTCSLTEKVCALLGKTPASYWARDLKRAVNWSSWRCINIGSHSLLDSSHFFIL